MSQPIAGRLNTLCETRRFRVVEQIVPRPEGPPANCQYVVHPGAVAILPLIDDDHLCLIRSRRLTVGQTLIEVPAGTREPNETPLETACRELKEETGYRAALWEPLAEFYTSPGMLTERMYVFVARDLTPGQPRREANEEIDNLIVTWTEALEKLDRGEIQDAKTIVAMLAFLRRRESPGTS